MDEEIAEKAEILQQLYSTLEDKQMQIGSLEILVKQMEKQEMRAQEQRTRLEKRIAHLELTLQSKTHKDYRYVLDLTIPSNPSIEKAHLTLKNPKNSRTPRVHCSQTPTSLPPSRIPSCIHDPHKLKEFARALELDKKYHRCRLASREMKCFYDRFIEPTVTLERSKDLVRHSRASRHDVGCYADVDQCGRESRGLISNYRQKSSACCGHSTKNSRYKSSARGQSAPRGPQ